MSAHTAGEWRIEATKGERVVIISAGENGYGDGPADYVMSDGGMSKADAERVCLAVNAHDKLVSALAALVVACESATESRAYLRARELLKAVEAERTEAA